MSQRPIRIACVLCAAISAILCACAVYQYQVQKSLAGELHPAATAQTTQEFTLSAATSDSVAKLFYIAGLLAALAGCFLLKADAEEREERQANARLIAFQRSLQEEEEGAED